MCETHVCTVCVYHGVSFSIRALLQSLTGTNLRKAIDPYLIPALWRITNILQNAQKLISTLRGIQTHNLVIDSSASYPWAIIASVGTAVNSNLMLTGTTSDSVYIVTGTLVDSDYGYWNCS